jgi:hypothetical protein
MSTPNPSLNGSPLGTTTWLRGQGNGIGVRRINIIHPDTIHTATLSSPLLLNILLGE